MDYYLEYLEHLQGKMDFSKNVDNDKIKLYFDLENLNQRLSYLFVGVLLSLELLLCVVGVTVDIMYRNIIVNAMLVVFLVFGILVLKYAGDARFYKNLACHERDTIYFANYDIIKNEILNDGDGQIRQLILWNDMCDLTVANQKRYKELLRIVESVCREYVEIYK